MIDTKKLTLILILLVTSLTGFSQFKISGRITDEEDKPIEFARIVLSVNDSIKQETFSAKDGGFSLMADAAHYVLKVYFIGSTVFQRDISIGENMELGTLKSQKTLSLAQVDIVSKHKKIERKIDRLVFNLEGTSLSAGGDAIDAFKITPGIRMKGDEISLVGKDRLQVMIDGKIVNLSGENLTDFLRSISSDNIKSIEVITTPPAKYDAEGNSGILNIVLKKKTLNFWNATIGAAYTQRTYGTQSTTGNLTYNKERLSFFTNYSLSDGSKQLDETNKVYYPDNLWSQNNPRKANSKSVSGRVGLAYDINKSWNTELQYSGSNSKLNIDDRPLTSISNYQNGETGSYISSQSETKKKPVLNSFTWNNTIKTDSSGGKLLVAFDYFIYKNSDSRNYRGSSLDKDKYILPDTFFSGFNGNDQKITNLSAKIDGESQFHTVNIEYGYKYSSSVTNNSIVFLNRNDAKSDPVADTSNYFKYNEKIHAAYLSGNKKINDKWETKLGLRMEATQSSGITALGSQKTSFDYVQFYPSAYLSYAPNANNNISLSYSRRVDRPKFEQLNPFKVYDSPYTYSEGNPFLQPAFTNNIELIHTYKEWENKLYYSKQNHGFEQFGIADPNSNITRFFVDNFLNSNKVGISESYTYDKISWWSSFNSLDLSYAVSRSSNALTQKRREGYSSYLSSYNDFSLNKKQTLTFSVNYWYSLPGVDGLDRISSANSLALAFKALFLDKKLQLTVAGSDVFGGERYTVTSYTNDIKLVYRNYYDNRSVRFSIAYKFGNQKIKASSGKAGNEDEQKRTSN
ncbi:TonB-dependent receptor [Pedobacter hartonius]|uniref:Outer membrane receptor proteins, mostly Fe transport n=1 Tax=Pedobacter hartonius TaxID=425514 RepID=A0A1H4BVW8_9SPHI|nr:TonB-dependent receptor [Pedobacter hartonius]SEA52234.1 Outer membrane receptor proteins, mostly Fe transport [Pedobacter hartonius]